MVEISQSGGSNSLIIPCWMYWMWKWNRLYSIVQSIYLKSFSGYNYPNPPVESFCHKPYFCSSESKMHQIKFWLIKSQIAEKSLVCFCQITKIRQILPNFSLICTIVIFNYPKIWGIEINEVVMQKHIFLQNVMEWKIRIENMSTWKCRTRVGWLHF